MVQTFTAILSLYCPMGGQTVFHIVLANKPGWMIYDRTYGWNKKDSDSTVFCCFIGFIGFVGLS